MKLCRHGPQVPTTVFFRKKILKISLLVGGKGIKKIKKIKKSRCSVVRAQVFQAEISGSNLD